MSKRGSTIRALRNPGAKRQRRRSSVEPRDEALRSQNLRYATALNNMSQGLCMFDQDMRLTLFNDRYLELYGLSSQVVKPGVTMREILEHSVALGNHAHTTAEELLRRYRAELERHGSLQIDRDLGDGRIVAISHRPMEGGGWVATFEDVTESRAREKAHLETQAKAERAESEARAAHARLRGAIEMLPEALVFLDPEKRVVLWNRKYAELYEDIADILAPGVSFEHVLRVSLARGGHPEEIEDQEAWLAHRLAQFENPQGPQEQRFRDGRWLRHEERRTSDGGSIGMRIDITDLKRREESFRLLFDSNPIPMWVCEPTSHRFLAVNDAAVAHYGYAREQLLTMSAFDLDDEGKFAPAEPMVENDASPNDPNRVWRHLKADGTVIEVLIFANELLYNGVIARLVAIVDVTERLRAQALIAHMAQHDALTGLPNRMRLRAKMEEALAWVRRGETVAVLWLDLDNFKTVNDTLGHHVGDALLKAVTERLQSCMRETDTVARLGGDEFVVLQPGLKHAEQSSALARRLIGCIGQSYTIEGHQVDISVSIGITIGPNDGHDADVLLKNADLALYRAKTDGRGTYRYFEPEMDAVLQRRRTLELELRRALITKEFELFYQPLVSLESGDVIGFEALLRWHHPERGLVAPAEFIPLAEEIGLIVPLGEWVIRRACEEAAGWPKNVKIAVNLSPAQFKSRTLVLAVASALASSGLSAHRLELEITESVLLRDNEASVAALHQLRQMGVRIALDDFGTGYSSLSYLRSFPFDKIKIDRSFVQDLSRKSDCMAIVRAVASLGASLGMITTAEGVETEEQLRQVREQGCTEFQGYLVSPPIRASELAPFLARAGTKLTAAG
jgi:diguanylate cyclase (GGDEF)-like protein/PAS domain S-box-containing protein